MGYNVNKTNERKSAMLQASSLLNPDDSMLLNVMIDLYHHADNRINLDEITDKYALTKYKLDKLFNSLNSDLAAVSDEPPAYVEQSYTNQWQAHNLTRGILNRARLHFLERSFIFPAFEYRFLYSNIETKADFLQTRFLSRTKYYQSEDQLSQLLETENEEVRLRPSNVSTHNELDTRLFLFEFYYPLYNGIADPFPELNDRVETVVRALGNIFFVRYRPVELGQLRLIIKIWLLRMQNLQFVETPRLLVQSDGKLDELRRAFPHRYDIPEHELDYLYATLVCRNLAGERNNLLARPMEDFPLQLKLTTKLMTLLKEAHLLFGLDVEATQALRVGIFQLHVQITTFYLAPGALNGHTELTKPLTLDDEVETVISRMIASLDDDPDVNTSVELNRNIHYDYLMLMATYLPIKFPENKIHIFIDFAQGSVYNDYIAKALIDLHHDFIEIEPELTDKANLYLSDYPANHLNTDQMIWAMPPSAADWRRLAEYIIDFHLAMNAKNIPQ